MKNYIWEGTIKKFVSDIMEYAREFIWLPRCQQVIKWERSAGKL